MHFTLYGLLTERKKIGDGGIFITDYLGAVGKKKRTVMVLRVRSQMFAHFSNVVKINGCGWGG
jgi:hypothetical protein